MRKGRSLQKNGTPKVQFTYLADELGHIVETHDPDLSHPVQFEHRLQSWRRPNKPIHIDTPEKLERWHQYWDSVIGWWDDQVKDEFRQRTWR